MSDGMTAEDRINSLEDLIRHCWVHSGYPDCGYSQMDGQMRRLYCNVISRSVPFEDMDHAELSSALARLVDSGDLDGARAMARGILEGEGKTHG